jgi:4-aminobutyrate aminotransferase/(S)-3-amino-2-methylpropionate transaminase
VWDRAGEALHTSTFLAHPLACAAALAALAVLEEEDLAGRAAEWEEALAANLAALADRSPIVGVVRGMGMMWGLELGPPDRPAHASANLAQTVVRNCLAGGVLLLRGGPGGNVLQLTPPLVLEEAEWRFASGVLGDALSAAGSAPAGRRRSAGRR